MTRTRIDTEELRKLLGEVTPGKWEATMTHPTNACANVDQANGYVSIATCYAGDEDSEQDEHGMWSSQPIRDANARLIALSPELADELLRLRAHAEAMAEALRPFADFANSDSFDKLPDEVPMTQGSRLARKQVTAADFKRALTAYRAATKETTDGK